MADIELVIKIPEESYDYWKKHKYEYVLAEAIANGVVLPKGHGRIVDIGSYEGKVIIEVAELDTIIEADKGE